VCRVNPSYGIARFLNAKIAKTIDRKGHKDIASLDLAMQMTATSVPGSRWQRQKSHQYRTAARCLKRLDATVKTGNAAPSPSRSTAMELTAEG
jgi:hypothetical protein